MDKMKPLYHDRQNNIQRPSQKASVDSGDEKFVSIILDIDQLTEII